MAGAGSAMARPEAAATSAARGDRQPLREQRRGSEHTLLRKAERARIRPEGHALEEIADILVRGRHLAAGMERLDGPDRRLGFFHLAREDRPCQGVLQAGIAMRGVQGASHEFPGGIDHGLVFVGPRFRPDLLDPFAVLHRRQRNPGEALRQIIARPVRNLEVVARRDQQPRLRVRLGEGMQQGDDGRAECRCRHDGRHAFPRRLQRLLEVVQHQQ